MNALQVINAARDLLVPLGHPVYIADFLNTDESGRLQLPEDVSHYVIHAITGTPEHEWGTTRFASVQLQVNAHSRVEGEALAMLQAASPALVAGKFLPGILVALARDGPYTGYAQAYERKT